MDDDRDDIDLLRLLLRKAELPNPLQIYRDGEQAIAFFSKLLKRSLKALQPLLCFLDLKTADVSGHEVLRWIRSHEELDRLPIVVLSASEHPRDIQEAAQAGAQCYLAKYPQPAVLKHVVADAERFTQGTPADECFRLPSNLILVRCRRLTPVAARAGGLKLPSPSAAKPEARLP